MQLLVNIHRTRVFILSRKYSRDPKVSDYALYRTCVLTLVLLLLLVSLQFAHGIS